MDGKTVSASAIFDYEIVIDLDNLSSDGALFEGRFMQIVNSLAMMVANRHAERACVAIGIDSLRFKKKVVRGDMLLCYASVNCAWLTTLEVGIKVVAEDFRSLDRKDVLSAYFTFAAVDDDHQPVEIAPVIPESQEQIQRFHDAEIRHQRHRDEDGLVPVYSSSCR
jgi:acyl-CoA hydrolase